MPTIDEMNLDEIETTISQLRERKRVLKRSGKTAERKIGTLERRRERLLTQLKGIEEQIAVLQREASLAPVEAPRRRGRRPKSAMITVAS